MVKMKKTNISDAISKTIQCKCKRPNCNRKLVIVKYPKKRLKIRIYDKEKVISIIILKKELITQIKELKWKKEYLILDVEKILMEQIL